MRPLQAQLCRRCARRAFSSSVPRNTSDLPTFSPTSSEELNDLLSTFRRNVLLPSALTRPQQRLVYRKSNAHILTGPEPATVKLGAETHTLYPLSRQHDEPGTGKSFNQVLNIMKETGEWENMEAWLNGLMMSGRKVKAAMWERLARVMVQSAEEGRLLKCASAQRYTGLSLGDYRVAREVLLGGLARAFRKQGSEADADAELKGRKGFGLAASYAGQVWDLLWQPAHAVAKSEEPLTSRPEVLGFMVLLNASKGANGKEEVERFMRGLLQNWDKRQVPKVQDEGWWSANDALLSWAPTVKAFQLAGELFSGLPLQKSMVEPRRELEGRVRSWVAVVESRALEGTTRRGVELVKQLEQLGH